MLRFFVAPISIEPGTALARPDHRQNLGRVIGQIQLDATERFDDVANGRVQLGITLIPRNVIAEGPAAFFLGLLKEVPVQPPHRGFQLGSDHKGRICHTSFLFQEEDAPRPARGQVL